MSDQDSKCEQAGQDGIPVQNARCFAEWIKIGPERLEKYAFGSMGTPRRTFPGGTEKDRQERTAIKKTPSQKEAQRGCFMRLRISMETPRASEARVQSSEEDKSHKA